MILWYGYMVWRGVPNAKTVPIPVGTHELITAGIPVPVPNPKNGSYNLQDHPSCGNNYNHDKRTKLSMTTCPSSNNNQSP